MDFCMFMYDWVPLLSTWKYLSTVIGYIPIQNKKVFKNGQNDILYIFWKIVACIYTECSLQIGVSVSKGKLVIYVLKMFFNLQFHHQYRLTPISLSN